MICLDQSEESILGLPHGVIPLLLRHQLALVVVRVEPDPVQGDGGADQ